MSDPAESLLPIARHAYAFIMRSLTSLLVVLTSLASFGASAISLDGDQELNQGLDPTRFHYMGQYSPRYFVDATVQPRVQAPLGCQIETVDSLERHGARHMTSGANKKTIASLNKIKKALANVSDDQLADKSLAFLRNLTISTETASLVPYGALQSYYSGLSTREVYPGLRSHEPFVRTSGDVATLDDRVIVTGEYWKLGFSGAPFPAGQYTTSDSVRNAAGLPKSNVILSEQDGFNNTLDVSTCVNQQKQNPKPEDAALAAYGDSTLVPVIGARLQERLQPAKINFTSSDILNLMSICSFETLGNANVINGKLSISENPVCGAFNEQEWKYYGYALSAGKYAGAGYGNEYYKAVGQGFLRELYARFNESAPPLQQPTSLNSTIDGNPATFPLPSSRGYRVFFDGSHDNNIGPIAAAFGLFDGPPLTTEAGAESKPHAWDFSKIAPLQGKIVFEKLSCLNPSIQIGPKAGASFQLNRAYVRVRANGAVQQAKDATWCPSKGQTVRDQVYIAEGLCPLEAVLGGLAWVNEAVEWNKCFT